MPRMPTCDMILAYTRGGKTYVGSSNVIYILFSQNTIKYKNYKFIVITSGKKMKYEIPMLLDLEDLEDLRDLKDSNGACMKQDIEET